MTLPKFDIDTFFQEDAKDIFSAREKGMAIHKTKNIDAAGDEIELPVKDILKKRLPQQYYVGQGHIVDSDLNTSGQFDIIIADNKGSPILFSSANETDYLTFESIYAIGEIKSTYYKSKNYVKDFINKVGNVNRFLQREPTPPDQLTQDLRFSTAGSISITTSDRRAYKNPLFKFMFFVNSGDVDFVELGNVLNGHENKDIPNVIIFLDKGIILKAEASLQMTQINLSETEDITKLIQMVKELVQWKLGNVDLWPEFIPDERIAQYRSVFYEFNEEKIAASCLAYIVYALNTHISECMVLKPNLIKYHNNLFKVRQAKVL